MAVIPVFLSPSSQPNNSCKYGDNEQNHMRIIAKEVDNLFKKDNRFISVVCDIVNGTDSQKLDTIAKTSDTWIDSIPNKLTGGLHLALHSNAGGGTGHECFYFSSNTQGKQLATLLCDEMSKISPWKTRACEPHDGFYEIHVPKATSVLLEVAFHDNLEQATWIHNNTIKIAKAVYNAVLRLFSFSEPTIVVEPPPVIKPVDIDKGWKQELINRCIENGLLEDKSWIENYNSNMPVYAVCKMFIKLLEIVAKIEKNPNINNSEEMAKLVLGVMKDIESKYEIVDIKNILRLKE